MRTLIRPAPIPRHLLGVTWVRTLLGGLAWLGVGVRWAAVPAALWLGGLTWTTLGCLLGALGVVAWSLRRRPRSVAAPLLEESAFLLGCGVACAAPLAPGSGVAAAGAGVLAAVGALGVGALVLHVTWGWTPEFVQMRQPRFRVLGDNPDSRTFVCRARADRAGWVVEVPPGHDGPVTIAATRLATLSVAGTLSFRDVDPVLARGPVPVGFGTEPAPEGLSIVVPAGRYVVAVRYYRPRADQPLPTMRRA